MLNRRQNERICHISGSQLSREKDPSRRCAHVLTLSLSRSLSRVCVRECMCMLWFRVEIISEIENSREVFTSNVFKLFVLFVWVFCLHVFCSPSVCSTHAGQKSASTNTLHKTSEHIHKSNCITLLKFESKLQVGVQSLGILFSTLCIWRLSNKSWLEKFLSIPLIQHVYLYLEQKGTREELGDSGTHS